jgi:hypothetical protein
LFDQLYRLQGLLNQQRAAYPAIVLLIPMMNSRRSRGVAKKAITPKDRQWISILKAFR